MKIKKMLKVISVLIIFLSITLFMGRVTNYTAHSALIESKPPLSGLVTMGNVNDLRHGKFDVLKEANIHPDVYSGVVIHTTWGHWNRKEGYLTFPQ